jgi:hypothetical protein
MREYKIKKGHDADISVIIEKYFNVKGDIFKGIKFEVEGIGSVDMKREKSLLLVDIIPPKKITGDYSVIKKWNDFLLDATGFSSKERKKDFGKVKK